MSADNKQLSRRWFEEVWNQRRGEAIVKMMASDAVSHGLGADGGSMQGPDAFVRFHQSFTEAFPDLKVHIEDLIAEDDKVVTRWRATGTLKGHGLGVRPTGRTMEITGISIVRVVNGQFVEGWNNFDVLGMHQQLGTLVELAATDSTPCSQKS
jgi:steroid delta-isomerase-like uncharacterized protein